MAAACARAVALQKKGGTSCDGAVELADLFCRQAERRVEDKFAAIWSNDDLATYAAARKVLDGKYAWLEEGIVGNLGGRDAPA
jgi:hypothetical protein